MAVKKVHPWKSKSLVEKQENCILEVHKMASIVERTIEETPCTNVKKDPMVLESAETSWVSPIEQGPA